MSLTTKLTKLFSKAESKDVLGVSLRQQSLAFFSHPSQGEQQLQQVSVPLPAPPQQIKIEQKKYQLQGQCHLVLAASQTQVVLVDKPNIPENEVNAALKWQIKDLVS